MPRAFRERPRRAGAAAVAVIAVLAMGWLAGAGTAGSSPRPSAQLATVFSTTTKTVTRTVTVPSKRGHKGQRRHRR